MSEEWHGLTFEQWLKMWDHAGWRESIACSLYEIARCRDAATPDRLMALQTLNEGVTEGILLKDPGFPELLRDVLLEIARGDSRPRLLFGKRRRRRMHSRLLGVRWMLQTGAQFVSARDAAQKRLAAESAESAAPTPDVDIPKYS